jgi:hypothetical protein
LPISFLQRSREINDDAVGDHRRRFVGQVANGEGEDLGGFDFLEVERVDPEASHAFSSQFDSGPQDRCRHAHGLRRGEMFGRFAVCAADSFRRNADVLRNFPRSIPRHRPMATGELGHQAGRDVELGG